ncbi:MAG: hypothetical protein IPP91_11265 [Betaproteobacteria bacterium]|nr:hypothetical protein [Betaproteobacteria bacterium]
MKRKWTEQELRAVRPGLTGVEIADLLLRVNRPSTPYANRMDADDPGLVNCILNPPPRDKDGLTSAMRKVNAFADQRGLPIPFPPK